MKCKLSMLRQTCSLLIYGNLLPRKSESQSKEKQTNWYLLNFTSLYGEISILNKNLKHKTISNNITRKI